MSTISFDDRAETWDDDPRKFERAAIIASRILELCPVAADARVLDFGAGTGLLGMHFVERRAAVSFADPSAGMRAQVQRKLAESGYQSSRAIAPADPAVIVNGGYDLVASLMAVHHVPDPSATIAQLSSWLLPGGTLALCDLEPEDGSFHDPGTTGVHHGFSPDELREWCDAADLIDFRCETVFTIEENTSGVAKSYPLFLMCARRRV
jgi:cyclopropane fatty-acyl-phospholipid synthase-like methyltransferase